MDGLGKADYEALAAFRHALRRFLRFSEEQALASGLPPQQHQALLAVMGMPGRDWATVGELAERLQIRHHSAVGLVSRLAEQGLATRDPSAADRRQVLVRLTDKGRAVLEALSAVHQREIQRLAPELAAALERLSRR